MGEKEAESNLGTLSNLELLELAKSSWSDLRDDARWGLIRELHTRPDDQVFHAAAAMCESEDHQHRAMGADILAKLGVLGQIPFPFRDASLPIFRRLLLDDEPLVICSAIFGLREQGYRDDLEDLVALAKHPSAHVRQEVASTLEADSSTLELNTLLELSTDPDESVRDWATFGLATCEVDSPDIRKALWNRVDDPHRETREEAIAGLASLKDPEILPLLIEELGAADGVSRLMVEAAEAYGDSSVLSSLLDLKPWWNLDPPLLARAIRACSSCCVAVEL